MAVELSLVLYRLPERAVGVILVGRVARTAASSRSCGRTLSLAEHPTMCTHHESGLQPGIGMKSANSRCHHLNNASSRSFSPSQFQVNLRSWSIAGGDENREPHLYRVRWVSTPYAYIFGRVELNGLL